MSEIEHTPGPWHIANGSKLLIHCGERWVASAMGIQGEEGEANANLIAASPDLLGALREATLALDCLASGEGVFKPIEQTIVKALAAIAKAEGRS